MSRQALITVLLSAALGAAGAAPCPAADLTPDFNLNRIRIKTMPPCRADIPPVPPPTDTGYYARRPASSVRLESYVRVEAVEGKGRAEIRFPRVKTETSTFGYRSQLFILLRQGEGEPELSWAAVLCTGGTYFGYKGSTVRLSRSPGRMAIKDDSLALGEMKWRLSDTHPWLAGGKPLDRLCAKGLPELRPFLPEALPRAYRGFALDYKVAAGALSVSWER